MHLQNIGAMIKLKQMLHMSFLLKAARYISINSIDFLQSRFYMAL